MANNSLGDAKKMYDKSIAAGQVAISSDFSLQIAGHEDLWVLTKQCPWAEAGSAGEIDVAMPIGFNRWEKQQQKIAMQGPLAFYETQKHTIEQAFLDILATSGINAGKFDCIVYHGVPERHVGGKRYTGCFFVPDSPDTDWENRSQVLMISGTLFYHYFGEIIPGNTPYI